MADSVEDLLCVAVHAAAKGSMESEASEILRTGKYDRSMLPARSQLRNVLNKLNQNHRGGPGFETWPGMPHISDTC